MIIAELTPFAQLALSVATVAIARSVYSVQSDKLFVEMRDGRIAALDRYREAINARMSHIYAINRTNVETEVVSDHLRTLMSNQWAAEQDMKRWFGTEFLPLIAATEQAVDAAAQARISWCSSDQSQRSVLMQSAFDAARAVLTAQGRVLDAGTRYVAAGHRGLPVRDRLSLLRTRVPSWKGVRSLGWLRLRRLMRW